MATERQLSQPVRDYFSAPDKARLQESVDDQLAKLERYLTDRHQWALARHLHYYSLVLRDLQRDAHSARTSRGKKVRKSGNVNAAWTSALEELAAFQSRVKAHGYTPGIFGSPQSLRNFALGQVTKAAWRFPRATIALFIIDEALQREDRDALGSKLRERLPECERTFLAKLRRDYLDGSVECPLGGEAAPPRVAVARSSTPGPLAGIHVVDDLPQIQSFLRERFAVDQKATSDLRGYFDSFQAGPKGYLHFSCLRGQRSKSASLVVSFLAIVPPEASALTGEFTFKHIYQIEKTHKPRISQGLVLPLTGGIYLVGGQQGYAHAANTFITLKIIAIPWRALRARDLVLPGLFMSASRDDQHLVGRIALRATGATRHDQASIGIRHITEIEQYLADLGPADGSETFKGRDQATKDLASQAARIADLANNQVREWDLVDLFRDAQGEELDRLTFETQVQKSFGRPADHRFRDSRARTFKFPDSLWLGPITTER